MNSTFVTVEVCQEVWMRKSEECLRLILSSQQSLEQHTPLFFGSSLRLQQKSIIESLRENAMGLLFPLRYPILLLLVRREQ
jgi:hypothetical protein